MENPTAGWSQIIAEVPQEIRLAMSARFGATPVIPHEQLALAAKILYPGLTPEEEIHFNQLVLLTRQADALATQAIACQAHALNHGLTWTDTLHMILEARIRYFEHPLDVSDL